MAKKDLTGSPSIEGRQANLSGPGGGRTDGGEDFFTAAGAGGGGAGRERGRGCGRCLRAHAGANARQ